MRKKTFEIYKVLDSYWIYNGGPQPRVAELRNILIVCKILKI